MGSLSGPRGNIAAARFVCLAARSIRALRLQDLASTPAGRRSWPPPQGGGQDGVVWLPRIPVWRPEEEAVKGDGTASVPVKTEV